ncbi:MAG: hypothetical protein ABJL99_03400 [Aliishimia sp.]
MARFTPFPEADPLDDAAGTERLRLADGVLLTAQHFQTEQLYHRARLARMLAYTQGPGTVAGLDVTWQTSDDPAGTELKVTPGLAIDYRGRLLELRHDACLNITDWMSDLADEGLGAALITAGQRPAGDGLPLHILVDLFADFRAFARRPEPAFATGNADQIDGTEATLSDDAVYLHLVVRDAEDERAAQSMAARLFGAGTPTPEDLQRIKREDLWQNLAPRPDTLATAPGLADTEHDLGQQDFGGVMLARLALPLVEDDAGARFDTSFNMNATAVAPDFSGRLYSYSAAELALLHGLRR